MKLSYRMIKHLILWTPTVTIGLWEYVRHTVLLPYVSMDLGNLLAPVIVLLVSATLLRKLFAMLEATQEELQRERMMKAALEEREQLARELHDGISQSLFLLSVKLDKLNRTDSSEEARAVSAGIRETIRRVYDDVRQSIANLRSMPMPGDFSWMASVEALGGEAEDAGIRFECAGRLPDRLLSNKEKVELLAIVREAVLNARKHANARTIRVAMEPSADGGFRCEIADDGIGLDESRLAAFDRYGIRMMRSRAEEMGWKLELRSEPGGGTTVTVEKTLRPDRSARSSSGCASAKGGGKA
jgi:two-component system nitrate/nitrite sensor histidine kinase NarQ